MNRVEGVFPWTLSDITSREFDLFIAMIGYERRARFVAQNFNVRARRCVAYAFREQRVESFRKNWQWYQNAGFDVKEVTGAELQDECAALVRGLLYETDRPLRVCVDISSTTRIRIAAILAALITLPRGPAIEVDFLYAPAKYTPPPRHMSQIETAGPILPRYAGWSNEPDQPVTAVFGLGYEYDKAVGTVEFVEPAQVWAFQASGRDARYAEEGRKANEFFWRTLPQERCITYSVDRPFDCFISLESLVFGILTDSRPLLVPFGPKLFTLCCLLVAEVHFPSVAVWRVTSGSSDPAVDRAPDGSVVGLRVLLVPADAAEVRGGSEAAAVEAV